MIGEWQRGKAPSLIGLAELLIAEILLIGRVPSGRGKLPRRPGMAAHIFDLPVWADAVDWRAVTILE